MVRKCESCQRHQSGHTQSIELLRSSVAVFPFDMWGMNLVGPLPRGIGQKKFLMVVVDYFSKWVEDEPLVHITKYAIIMFMWKNIVCWYDIPQQLISDNG